jgi:hypothetical protein
MLALSLGAAGCSRGPALPKGYPATGTVVYQGGQPMKGGTIQFNNATDPLLRVVGQVDGNGAFRLRTIKDAEGDGAPEGEYEVVIHPLPPAHKPGDKVAAHKMPDRITLEETYNVEAKENTFKIVLPVASP